MYNLLMRITMYQIEHFTLCDGWINTSTDEHGEAVLFGQEMEKAQATTETALSESLAGQAMLQEALESALRYIRRALTVKYCARNAYWFCCA